MTDRSGEKEGFQKEGENLACQVLSPLPRAGLEGSYEEYVVAAANVITGVGHNSDKTQGRELSGGAELEDVGKTLTHLNAFFFPLGQRVKDLLLRFRRLHVLANPKSLSTVLTKEKEPLYDP